MMLDRSFAQRERLGDGPIREAVDDDVLYLMEDMATGEIRLSILWEWLHKKARLTDDDQLTKILREPGSLCLPPLLFLARLFSQTGLLGQSCLLH